MNGIGGIAPCPSYQLWFPLFHNSQTIIIAGIDIPIVNNEEVSDALEPPYCLIVVLGDGLLADIAAGHHQGHAGFPEQHMVQRGIWEHHPQILEFGRYLARYRGIFFPSQQQDGAL